MNNKTASYTISDPQIDAKFVEICNEVSQTTRTKSKAVWSLIEAVVEGKIILYYNPEDQTYAIDLVTEYIKEETSVRTKGSSRLVFLPAPKIDVESTLDSLDLAKRYEAKIKALQEFIETNKKEEIEKLLALTRENEALKNQLSQLNASLESKPEVTTAIDLVPESLAITPSVSFIDWNLTKDRKIPVSSYRGIPNIEVNAQTHLLFLLERVLPKINSVYIPISHAEKKSVNYEPTEIDKRQKEKKEKYISLVHELVTSSLNGEEVDVSPVDESLGVVMSLIDTKILNIEEEKAFNI